MNLKNTLEFVETKTERQANCGVRPYGDLRVYYWKHEDLEVVNKLMSRFFYKVKPVSIDNCEDENGTYCVFFNIQDPIIEFILNMTRERVDGPITFRCVNTMEVA